MDEYNDLLMNECPPDFKSPDDEPEKTTNRRKPAHSKGVAMSFGFRKRPATAPVTDNATAARRLAKHEVFDQNGNGDTEPLTNNALPPGRTTPRLAPPKKEANATRVSRFGFRQPNANRFNRVADINNAPPTQMEYKNNNRPLIKEGGKMNAPLQPKLQISNDVIVDSNENRSVKTVVPQPQINKFTLQTCQLPRPQLALRVMETKSAKTLANNNKKAANGAHHHEDTSSKEGSVTEDSGVGSNASACGNMEIDTMRGIDLLDSSPTYASSRKNQRPRQLEMVVSGMNFDLRDLDDLSNEPAIPLPRLPSAFQGRYNSGFVRERRLEYEKYAEKYRRKISHTSSEGFSDDYTDINDKKQTKTNMQSKSFLKQKPTGIRNGSSPPSSDEHDWDHAGEAMADDFSYSLSSSDESKEREKSRRMRKINTTITNLQNQLNTSFLSKPKNEVKNVLLTIEDPKFAAVVAATNTITLLEDETSPVDSLICSCSESEDFIKNKFNKSLTNSSNSKDVNEKLTLSPSSPGTPTNASNSLSLSEGRDFLIDDEIADQPALIFDDTITTVVSEAISNVQQYSDNTLTVVDNTPKLKRKMLGSFEGSPLFLRRKNLLNSRAGSVDTLSPCESIASDDLMMDFDYSQSSGLDENNERFDPKNAVLHSFNDLVLRCEPERNRNEIKHDWSANLSNNIKNSPKSLTRTSRLLRSRASTPNSLPDSPCSLDSRINGKALSVASSRSPMRLPRGSLGSGSYDSDDSIIKYDRASHGAIVQDIMGIKTMLLKLKRVLHESETLNPFDNQQQLKNGLFNGLSSDANSRDSVNEEINPRLEMADLKRQILFLQGQLEDRERTVYQLQHEMTKLISDTQTANSAPASTVASDVITCNAATQTERVRPISAGPSLLQMSPTDGNTGSLVSASETPLRYRPHLPSETMSAPLHNNSRLLPPKLWRKPGEPPSPQRFSSHSPLSIPRRTSSRSRTPSTPS